MEDTLDQAITDLLKFEKPRSDSDESDASTTSVSAMEEAVTSGISVSASGIITEDSNSVFNNLFTKREVFIKEDWAIEENIQAKIVKVNDSNVFADCLIDIESRTFQHRSFSAQLFSHIPKLAKGDLVIIKTRMKEGSFRVDVFPGGGIANKSYFIQNDKWKSLEGEGLDEKLTKW
jgi:hypothetical protein